MLREKGFEEESYAYLACMAVARDARRSGAATALLGAAERMAGKWQQNFVLLHTFADNFPGAAPVPCKRVKPCFASCPASPGHMPSMCSCAHVQTGHPPSLCIMRFAGVSVV